MKPRFTHDADLEVVCPVCLAPAGEECLSLPKRASLVARPIVEVGVGVVHFPRRLCNISRDPETRAIILAVFGEPVGEA